MKEIGGFLELENFSGTEYHKDALALNCGRNALGYLLKAKKIKKMYIPFFCCNVVSSICSRLSVPFEYYSIDSKFRPIFNKEIARDEYIYIVNYYGQITNAEVINFKDRFGNIIFDNAQAFFQKPVEFIDTIYTCRKFFGVSDGAYLYTSSKLDEVLATDESYRRLNFVLGRYEKSAGEFYKEASENNDLFDNEDIKWMSKITHNFLRAIDYDSVCKKRLENFEYVHKIFQSINKLEINVPNGAFMYPLFLKDGGKIRRKLHELKIFIPTLWPDVFDVCESNTLEYQYAESILPIPCDQRYGIEEMNYMIQKVKELIKE